VPVNPNGGGDVTRALCMGQPDLIKAVEEMATGNTMFAAALNHRTKVQLVPCRQHLLLLGSVQTEYTHKQVFLERSDQRSNGPFYHTIHKAKPGELQMFLLRAFAMSGNAESDKTEQQLAFLVKVFSTRTDRSCNSGLKLALVYAQSLAGDKSTIQKYVQDGSTSRPPEQGPRIVMPKHMAASPAPSPALGGTKHRQRRATTAAGNKEGKQSASTTGPKASAASDAQHAEEEMSTGMLVWSEQPMDGGGSQPKKKKIESIEDLVPRFGSGTCESLVPASFAKQHKSLSPAEFGLTIVMKGHVAVPPTSLLGHDLRKDRAAVWSALYEFWASVAMQSVAGVMALALDGYGHGKMNVLTKLQYGGCCGRWDMMAVLAAKHLGLFPPKYVSPARKCPTSPFMSAMMYFMST